MSPTLFLFQFFHEIDIKRVLDSGPWTFEQHILLVHRLEADEQPQQVPLFHTTFWVQAYNIPIGFQSEKVVQSIGTYIGSFLESDVNNFKGVWRNYMRLRVSIDVRKPLKRRMRMKPAGGDWIWVDFKYERLNTFCFICGLLSHTERNCPSLYEDVGGQVTKPYDPWMKAPTRKGMMNSGKRWLRNEPLEMEASNFGNKSNSGSVMIMDAIMASKSVSDVKKPSGMHAADGNVAMHKENEAEYDSALIVSDTKRRRSQIGQPSLVGRDDSSRSDMMEITTNPKNGVAVGLVNQAHREQ